MKVPAQTSLIQSIVSLQDVSKAASSPAVKGDRRAQSGWASTQSTDISVDAGGRSFRDRAARPNPAEKSDARFETRAADESNKSRPTRNSQREVPNTAPRQSRNQPLGQYVDILV